MHAVFRVRSEPTAEAWLAAIFDRNRFGMAMAAIIRMIATTIKSSINEKPFCLLRIELIPPKAPIPVLALRPVLLHGSHHVRDRAVIHEAHFSKPSRMKPLRGALVGAIAPSPKPGYLGNDRFRHWKAAKDDKN